MAECVNVDFISRDSGFVLIHQNIRSLRANFDTFIAELNAIEKPPQIIVLTEIWVDSNETYLYNIPNYNSFFNCNDSYRAGGVVVYFHSNFNVVNMSNNVKFVSADTIELSFKFLGYDFLLLAVYRLQQQSAQLFLNELNSYLRNDYINKCNNFVMVGDININLLEESSIIDEYKLALATNGLESLINNPTRITNKSKTCIDHIIVKLRNKNRVLTEAAVVDSQITDHCLTAVWFSGPDMGAASADSLDIRRSYRINHDQLNNLLDNTDWGDVFLEQNASTAFDVFYDKFHTVLEKCKEISNKKPRNIDKLKPWISNEICKRICKKNRMLKKIKKQPNNTILRSNFINFRNKLHSDIRNLKHNYYETLFEKHKGNSKKTWKIVKEISNQTQNRTSVITLDINGTLVSEPSAVANEFNNFFLSVAETLNISRNIQVDTTTLNYKQCFPERPILQSMYMAPVMESEIRDAVNSLKNGTSPGIDGINSSIIKMYYHKIAHLLLHLINLSFDTGIFPEKLKEAVVIPIHKSNTKLTCSNYRPISLLSTFSKLYEKIMKKRLISFLNKINFFSENQFGFRQGMNTETALLEFMDRVSNGINDGKKVSGLFLDIQKAFDTVDHQILLTKLYNSGVRGVVYRWFKSYLMRRTQCVRINGLLSDKGYIKYGVPQGSVLGALLFLIYINDLCCGNFYGKIVSFADDTALCYVERQWNEIEIKMNMDLKALQLWFTKNNMLLSPTKTHFMNFSLRGEAIFQRKIMFKCIYCIINGGQCAAQCSEVHPVESIKYLGVVLDSELKFKNHILNLKLKIIKILRLFYFLRNFCSSDLLRILYFSLVHSRLDYGIICWGGTYRSNLQPIYVIQKNIVRIIGRKTKIDESFPIFCAFKILPLQYMFIYKVLRVFFVRSRSFVAENAYKLKLRNPTDFFVPRPTNTYFTKTYYFLAPRMFNRLPNEIQNSKTITFFANKLRKWLFTVNDIEEMLIKVVQ